MEHDLKKMFECFIADSTFMAGEPFGSGHIHETFYIKTAEQEKWYDGSMMCGSLPGRPGVD